MIAAAWPRGSAQMIAVIAALSLAQAEAPAPAAPPEAGHVVVAPDWAALPKAKDMIDYAPAALKEKGLGGEAILRCRVSVKGLLTDCVVQSEKPEGMGFGEAAL